MATFRALKLWLPLLILIVIMLSAWMVSRRSLRVANNRSATDLSITNPLNQRGGGTAPADAYEVYSALYQAPMQEPLVFAEDSITDIPQVNGSCLKPSTAEEHEMADAFVRANQQSHLWEPKFSIPPKFRLLSHHETEVALNCLDAHEKRSQPCESYQGVRHIRFLGVPGFNHAHTKALVSVIKKCGGFCGSGGIFAVERVDKTWQRTPSTEFTQDCSWMY